MPGHPAVYAETLPPSRLFVTGQRASSFRLRPSKNEGDTVAGLTTQDVLTEFDEELRNQLVQTVAGRMSEPSMSYASRKGFRRNRSAPAVWPRSLSLLTLIARTSRFTPRETSTPS